MAAPRTLFIADQFADTDRDPESRYPGGAEQTDEAILAAAPWPVDRVAARDATPALLERYDLHVIGNLALARPELLQALARLGRHVLFEHDLRICRHRGNFPAARDPVHRWIGRCVCPHRRWRPMLASSLGMIFLTALQLSVYRSNPFFSPPAVRVLGSSVFGQDFFDRVRRAPRVRAREGSCMLQSPQRIKGTRAALRYCRRRGMTPHGIRNLAYDEVLDLLERSRLFVFLPTHLEPAGRMPVEARFLGCEIVANRNVGVTGEPWWHLPDAEALEVLRDAGPRFWRLVEELRDTAPDRTRPSERGGR
ncbi:MAG: hypothetical protein MUE48_04845 [Desulfobacterales bacterium]|jgi:hypothetical protein|nr:hypothetical protein [Desulfobacterales bacterium]